MARARTKAALMKDLYRNPEFKGGMCSCCGVRPRNWAHPDMPHMCDKCRDTRAGHRTEVSYVHTAITQAPSAEAQIRATVERLLGQTQQATPNTPQISKEQELINRARAEDWSAERFQTEYEKLKLEESSNEQHK